MNKGNYYSSVDRQTDCKRKIVQDYIYPVVFNINSDIVLVPDFKSGMNLMADMYFQQLSGIQQFC